MRATGYTDARAAPHDAAARAVITELNDRGYACQELPVDGHRPDAQFHDGDYLEIKTSDTINVAIEINDIDAWQHIRVTERCRVYVVIVRGPSSDRWHVHTPETLQMLGGPRRHSGTGSNDDWYLCNGRGTPFDEFFPERWGPA
jgi:hypothetical protein